MPLTDTDLFDVGNVYVSDNIARAYGTSPVASSYLYGRLLDHAAGKWGDGPIESNDDAVMFGGSVVSVHPAAPSSDLTVWIRTDITTRTTVILFPEDVSS